DEARLLGGKQTLRGPRGQLRVRPERSLGFHDGAHSPCGDVRMLPDESLRGRERRESPVPGRGRPGSPAHVQQDLADAELHAQARAPAVTPVAVRDALLDGIDSIPGPVGAGAPRTGNDPDVVPLEVDARFL